MQNISVLSIHPGERKAELIIYGLSASPSVKVWERYKYMRKNSMYAAAVAAVLDLAAYVDEQVAWLSDLTVHMSYWLDGLEK